LWKMRFSFQICPFPQFDLQVGAMPIIRLKNIGDICEVFAQVRYFVKTLVGEARLPSAVDMEKDREEEILFFKSNLLFFKGHLLFRRLLHDIFEALLPKHEEAEYGTGRKEKLFFFRIIMASNLSVTANGSTACPRAEEILVSKNTAMMEM